jgi:predicted RND superfamily exporter protein
MPATPAAMTRARLATLEAALAPVRDQYADHAVSVTGIVALGAQASNRLIAGLKQSLALAVVITIAVVALSLRSVVLALLSAIPNLLSLTIVAAGVYVIGERLQIPSVLALTIAFGIAVDNTIHLLNRYRVERRRAGVDDALAVTAEKVGPVLIAATIVLTVGMGVTMLSGLPMIRLFGSLCVVVLLTALAVALIVLPALVSFMSRRFPDL